MPNWLDRFFATIMRMIRDALRSQRPGREDPAVDPIKCGVGYCYNGPGCLGAGGIRMAGRGLMTEKACVIAAGKGQHAWAQVAWPLEKSANGWREINCHYWDDTAPPHTELMC